MVIMLKYKNNYKLNSVIGLHKPRTLPLTFKVFAVCVEYQPDTPVSEISACSHSICKLDRDVGSKYLHLKYENSSQGQRLKNLITSKVYDNTFISSFINL